MKGAAGVHRIHGERRAEGDHQCRSAAGGVGLPGAEQTVDARALAQHAQRHVRDAELARGERGRVQGVQNHATPTRRHARDKGAVVRSAGAECGRQISRRRRRLRRIQRHALAHAPVGIRELHVPVAEVHQQEPARGGAQGRR